MPERFFFMVKVNGEWVRATKNGYPIACERWQLSDGSPVEPLTADFYVPIEELMR